MQRKEAKKGKKKEKGKKRRKFSSGHDTGRDKSFFRTVKQGNSSRIVLLVLYTFRT